MEKTRYIIAAAAVLLLTSCEGFLTKEPETQLTSASYFSTPTHLELWTNNFYYAMPDQDDAATQWADDVFAKVRSTLQQGTRSASSESWSWSNLRNINYFFENEYRCSDAAARRKYEGVAHFFRAHFYWLNYRKYGDMPYYDYVISSDDIGSLRKPRDSRGYIAYKIMQDLDSAAAKLPEKWPAQPVYHVSKAAALALKSRVALFEGTFRKYHGVPDEVVDGETLSPEWFLTRAAEAAHEVMGKGYSLYSRNDKGLVAGDRTPYREYFTLGTTDACETILAKRYETSMNITHSVQFNMANAQASATRRFVNHYLMADGTTFQSLPDWETKSYFEQFQGRDPRLAQTIQAPGYVQEADTLVSPLLFTKTLSGYRIIKYVSSSSHDQGAKSETDYPYIRYAEVLLNYAEAKAELGTLTTEDVNETIDLIRERAGVAPLSSVPSVVDPLMKEYYPNASGTQLAAILEIRRERTVELVCENFRIWDLIRWKEGKWICPAYTGGFSGIYLAELGEQELDGDETPDAYFYRGANRPSGISKKIPQENVIRLGTNTVLTVKGVQNKEKGYLTTYNSEKYQWDEEKDYLWPIPLSQIQETGGALSQNPGYEDIER